MNHSFLPFICVKPYRCISPMHRWLEIPSLPSKHRQPKTNTFVFSLSAQWFSNSLKGTPPGSWETIMVYGERHIHPCNLALQARRIFSSSPSPIPYIWAWHTSKSLYLKRWPRNYFYKIAFLTSHTLFVSSSDLQLKLLAEESIRQQKFNKNTGEKKLQLPFLFLLIFKLQSGRLTLLTPKALEY